MNFEIHEGEIFGVIGTNGSGKTTLFNVITGFLKADGGKVTFLGKDITNFPAHQICRLGVARIFQIVRPFPQLTTLQNAMVGRAYGKDPAANIRKAEKEIVEILTLSAWGTRRKSSRLSSPWQSASDWRSHGPWPLIPACFCWMGWMAGLNLSETETAMGLVNKIRDSGITVIMVEHIMKAVLGICERVIALNAGQIIAEGPPKEVVKNPLVVEAYLGK